MTADQAAGSASLLLLLLLGLMGVFGGLGIMLSGLFGPRGKSGENGLGSNVGKLIFVFVFGLMIVFWLASPGAGQGIAAFINAIWANIVTGLQPVVAIVTQLGMIGAVLIVGYYAIR